MRGCLQAGRPQEEGLELDSEGRAGNWKNRASTGSQHPGKTLEETRSTPRHSQAASERSRVHPGTGIQARAVATKKVSFISDGSQLCPHAGPGTSAFGLHKCQRRCLGSSYSSPAAAAAAGDRALLITHGAGGRGGTVLPGSSQVLRFPAASPHKGQPLTRLHGVQPGPCSLAGSSR